MLLQDKVAIVTGAASGAARRSRVSRCTRGRQSASGFSIIGSR